MEEGIIYYEGPPFRPPGWDNGNGFGRPHPVPEPSAYGLIIGLILFGFYLLRRR